MGTAPTIYVGLRLPTTTYVYDDPHHPDRVTSTVTSPPFTPEDRALLAGYAVYEQTLCPGCGQPRHEAWHSDMDGYYETQLIVCHACTAKRDDDEKTRYQLVWSTRDLAATPLPPFVLTGAHSTTAED